MLVRAHILFLGIMPMLVTSEVFALNDESATLFLKYNYEEPKQLCLHFLTLVSAILVF